MMYILKLDYVNLLLNFFYIYLIK